MFKMHIHFIFLYKKYASLDGTSFYLYLSSRNIVIVIDNSKFQFVHTRRVDTPHTMAQITNRMNNSMDETMNSWQNFTSNQLMLK